MNRHQLDGAETELEAMHDEWTRLSSRATLLINEYTELAAGQREYVCTCRDSLGHAVDDPCEPRENAAIHECLAGLLIDHEPPLRQHLTCVVPILTKHTECIEALAGCDSKGFEECDAVRERAVGECPPLAPALGTAFEGCSR